MLDTRTRARAPKTRWTLAIISTGLALTMSVVLSGRAEAQEPPPAPPPAMPAADMPPPPPPVEPMAPPPVVVAPMVMPPPAPVTPPPAPIDYNTMKMNAGLRVGGRLQGSSPATRDKLNDFGLDTIYVESRFSGQVVPMFGWQANFNASVGSGGNLVSCVGCASSVPMGQTGVAGAVGIMDLIVKFDAHELFHLWAGRLLVPSDRSNFSGPYFMSPWNYPGVYNGAYLIGPKTGANGRDNGVVAWGQVLGGKGKYYLGAFNLDTPQVSPLISGRINICLLGAEDGFYHSSTYYGSQDILAIGGGFQYQKDASAGGTKALANVMVDLLGEKNLGAGGVGTFEGAYYHFDSGQPLKQGFFVLASWLTPEKLGLGKLQPLVRWQQASPQGAGPSIKMLDVFVTYVIAGYDARIALGYTHTDTGASPKANAIQLGVQLQH